MAKGHGHGGQDEPRSYGQTHHENHEIKTMYL